MDRCKLSKGVLGLLPGFVRSIPRSYCGTHSEACESALALPAEWLMQSVRQRCLYMLLAGRHRHNA